MLLVVRLPLLAAHGMWWCPVFLVASRMCSRPRACCLLSDARCLLHALPVFTVFCAVSAACRMLPCSPLPCCPWSVACRLRSFPRRLLPVARCASHVAWCLLRCMSFVVRCMLLEVWRMLPVARCMSFVVRCKLHAACRTLSGCFLLHAARCLSHFPRCILHVVGCIFPVACRLLSVAHFPVVVGGTLSVGSCLRARSLLRVVYCLLPVPVSPVACRALSVACRTSHLVTLHVLRCESSVACCIMHVPCCMLSVGCRLSHLACRLLPVAEWQSAITHAAHRGGARH
jgi:hypothetical protein